MQNVVTYDAVIDVDNPELKLRPGMTANVTFVYAEQPDVLRIPNSALRFRLSPEILAKLGAGPAGQGGGKARGRGGAGAGGMRPQVQKPPEEAGRRTVFVLRDGKPQPVSIQPGVSDGSQTEVVAGDLKEGDQVITDVSGPGATSAPAEARAAARCGCSEGWRCRTEPRCVAGGRHQGLPDGRRRLRALRGVSLPSTRASSWRSWARRARASRR